MVKRWTATKYNSEGWDTPVNEIGVFEADRGKYVLFNDYDSREGELLSRVEKLETENARLREGIKVLDSTNDEIENLRRELAMRRKPLNYPGDEKAVELAGLPRQYCDCRGGYDGFHHDYCSYWKWVLASRKAWHDKHVVAYSCSRDERGDGCKQWCGRQATCTASTRDDIEIACSQSDASDD